MFEKKINLDEITILVNDIKSIDDTKISTKSVIFFLKQ